MSQLIFYLLTILVFLIYLTSLAPSTFFYCPGAEFSKGYLPRQTHLPLEELSCLVVSVQAFFILWEGFVHHQEKMNLNHAIK